jgi:hypothetical protein
MRIHSILIVAALVLVTFGASPLMAAPVLYGLGNTDLNQAIDHSFLYTINTTTGAATLVGDTGSNLRGLAYNPFTGKAYASLAEREVSGGLYEINLATGAATFIGGTQNFSEMEFDASGNLFGYGSRQSGSAYDFFKIDVNTGVGTLLNSNALNPGNHALFGIAYSSADNEMYLYQQWFTGSGGEGLWTVDTTDGTVTSVVSGVLQQFRPDIAADDSGNLYAIDRNNVTSLYTLDKTTGNTAAIGSNGVGLNSIAFTGDVTAVPEPSSLSLMALAAAGFAGDRLRRRKRGR